MAGALAICIEIAQGNGQHRAVAVYRGLKQSAFKRAQAFAVGSARFGEKRHRATKMQFFGNHGIDFGRVFALGAVDEQSRALFKCSTETQRCTEFTKEQRKEYDRIYGEQLDNSLKSSNNPDANIEKYNKKQGDI